MFVEIPRRTAEIGDKLGTNSCIATRYWKENFHKIAEEDFNRMQKESKMKKTVEKKRKTITIDITDWYDSLKDISQREIRSIEEQCKFFIKKGIDGNGDIITITTWPAQTPLWATSTGDTSNVAKPFSDDTVFYCKNDASTTVSSKVGSTVDCELNKSTGCYEAKC